ncbi:ER to Golgi transport protein Yif1 [Phyllosticta citricarpa]|uniref:Protein YIF1 n=1 Tax=Phyllosticta citricarpa TaxID=55181 RepID=A0ABR1LIM9_9PEZI
MQRQTFGPAQSPPLHHPVPQHISQVPNLRSPPPPQPQPQAQANSYGYPQQNPQQNPQQGGGFMQQPGFGGFLNDPTAQMGFSIGQNAARAGQEYMEQNFNRYVNVNALKHYFNVTNSYVVNKLFLVLFPWRHRPWVRQNYDGFFLPPREDINSPDMYIPVMAFVTYILLSTLLAGIRGAFHPELLGITATKGFAVVLFEILGLKLGCYFLSISNDSQLLDLVAYSGYKFVGIIVTLIVAEVFNKGQGSGGWVGWVVFFYTFMALAFFLLRSLKYVLLPDTAPNASGQAGYTIARNQRYARTQFLFFYSYIVQGLFMLWLSSQSSGSQPANS